MSRRHFTFTCEGANLVAALDDAPGECGLLLVSGGNELRSGAWGGQARLAAVLAGSGHPVLRYDRRGVGDSEGENHGFRSAGPDLAAAIAAFRREVPHLRRIVAFGNCDAASVLALHGAGQELDALVLANPWTVDGDEAAAEAMPPSAIRTRYRRKLLQPSEWLRFLRGGVNIAKLLSGLRRAAAPSAAPSPLARQMHEGLATFAGPVTILLASGDRTAQIFEEAWPAGDPRVLRIASRSHSFSDEAAQVWLTDRLREALAG